MTDTTAPPTRATRCPRCGGAFGCGVDAAAATPCFCASYALGERRLAALRATWADCLCATCLGALAADPERPA